MAHFLEHLVFKGGEIYDDYRKVNETAERMGGVLNAYTSHDLVAFHITVRAESAMQAMDLLTDFAGRPKIDAEELDKERGVVIQEIQRYKDQPAAVAERADRARRLRRPSARPHRARARGAPAHASRARRSSPSASGAGRDAAAARSSSATSTTSPPNGAGRRADGALPRPARARAPPSRSPPFEPQTLVEQRETNQSHLRMIYRPEVDAARRRRARRVRRLRDAARRLDGLAPVRRDPRAARPRLLGLGVSHAASDVSSLLIGAGLDSTQVRRGLHAHARDRRRAGRRRPARGGGRARALVRRRPPRAGVREHERRRELRGPPHDRPRRGLRSRRRDRRRSTR